jgi:hypothetical protein
MLAFFLIRFFIRSISVNPRSIFFYEQRYFENKPDFLHSTLWAFSAVVLGVK